MEKIFKLKSFWLVFILSTVVFYGIFSDFSQSYRFESKLLAIPQNEKIVLHFPYLLEDLQILAQETRKENDSQVNFRLFKKSGLIQITSFSQQASWAEFSGQKFIQQFEKKIANYYSSQDLVFKTISLETIPQKINGIILLTFKSLFFSFLLSLCSFLISFSLFKDKDPEKLSLPVSFSWPKDLPKKKISSEKSKKNKILKDTFIPAYIPEKTAAAPNNLPTVEKEENQPENKNNSVKEASQEEIKERLNKLLSGKLF